MYVHNTVDGYTYHKLLVHTKDLSDIAKDTLDILIVNNWTTPLGGMFKWLFEDLKRELNIN